MSEERPNKCPNCEAPVVWCACIVKSCPICNTIPKVGGGMIVHPLCDCFDEKYIEFDAWQSRHIEDELRAEIARRDEELALTEKKLCNIDRSARAEIARLTAIIARLKEDGERLASGYEQVSREAVPYCVVCKKDAFSGYLGQIKHDDWCPITLHRALMEKLKQGDVK